MVKNPDQGTMLLPGAYGNENIVADERQFTKYLPPRDILPEAPTGLSAGVVERNRQVLQAIGMLGVIAETAPAIDLDQKPDLQQSFIEMYGPDYQIKVDQMLATNDRVRTAFNELFKKMWGLDEIKKSGLLDEEAGKMFTEDKDEFVARFSRSQGVTTHRAQLSRRNYRSRLRKQAKVYKQNNLGIWFEESRKRRRPRT